MPIRITQIDCEESKEIAWLCGEDWELPTQIEALEKWLMNNAPSLGKGEYAADVGFSPRPGASGGGGVITPAAMAAMVSVGMSLYLSEYPSFRDDAATEVESGQ